MRLLRLYLIFACFAAGPALAADLENGAGAFEVCAACHGPDGAGKTALNAPRISGMPAWYMERQLHNVKKGIRGADPRDIWGTQMRPMVLTLADDAAVADVAAYIETLDSPMPEPTLDGDAEQGKIYYATCAACHGPQGQGMEALNAPPLVGLDDWYIVRQIEAFKGGLRGTHADDVYGAQMRPMAMTLPDEQAARDVAAYIATLR